MSVVLLTKVQAESLHCWQSIETYGCIAVSPYRCIHHTSYIILNNTSVHDADADTDDDDIAV